MSFTNKNLHHSSKRSINFLKGVTFFFLGMSIVLFMAKAFEVIPVATNNNMLTKKISFTQDGTPSGTETITIDGSGGIIQAKVLSGETVCINGDCQTSRPSGGGTSVWSTGTSNEVYYNSGNVGIGTNTPQEKLEVHGKVKVGNGLKLSSPSADGIIESSSKLSFNTSGDTSSKMVIDTLGNVGIGTSSPYYKLDVNGTGRFKAIFGDKDLHILGMNGGANSGFGGNVYINGGGGDVGFGNIILGNMIGNVGIGTGSPQAKLHVAGTGYFDGNVGIGTNNPQANLHVAGRGKFTKSVQVGYPESNRCTTMNDAGKIVYYHKYSSGKYTPTFAGCIGSGYNSVIEIIFFTGASYTSYISSNSSN